MIASFFGFEVMIFRKFLLHYGVLNHGFFRMYKISRMIVGANGIRPPMIQVNFPINGMTCPKKSLSFSCLTPWGHISIDHFHLSFTLII